MAVLVGRATLGCSGNCGAAVRVDAWLRPLLVVPCLKLARASHSLEVSTVLLQVRLSGLPQSIVE